MSTAAQRFAQAGPATFVVHASTTLLALWPALGLSASYGPGVPARASSLALLQWLVQLERSPLLAAGPNQLAGLLGWLALSPLLALLWLSAMSQPARLRVHAARSAARYPLAAALALSSAAFSLACLAAGYAGAHAMQAALAFTHDDRVRDLSACAAAVPFATLALYGLVLHDVAMASVALGAASVRAAIVAATRHSSLRLVLLRAAVAAGSLALFGFGLIVPRLWLDTHDGALLIVSQCLALGSTLLRGRWLATVVATSSTLPPSL